jgi:hypothetical protein
MKFLSVVTVLAVSVISAAAFAGQAEFGSGVFSPERGVVCDREGNFCADGTGISASWTEQYMGAEAAHNLGEYDTTEFILHNGVDCVVQDQRCTVGGKVTKTSKAIGKLVFGK